MNQYNEYTKIETHIDFATRLFLIDKRGNHLIKEIEQKKYDGKKKSGSCRYNRDMKKVRSSLISVLNVRRFCPRLYLNLIYFLDEILFKEVGFASGNKFYIGVEEYDLTKIYFDPKSWVLDQEVQPFCLDQAPVFDITEAMCMICFMREYEDFLMEVERYARDNCKDDKRLKKGLLKTSEKIRFKLKQVWDIVLNVVTTTIKNESEEKI